MQRDTTLTAIEQLEIDQLNPNELRELMRETGCELELRGAGINETNEEFQHLLDRHDYASERITNG